MATTTTPARLAPARLPDRARLLALGRRAALVGAILLGELILAGALASGRLTVLLMAFAAAVGLALVFAFPFAAAVALMVVGGSVFHADWFAFGFGPLDTQLSEVLLVALLTVAVVRPRRRTWGGVPGAALAIFLAAIALASVLGVAAGKIGLQESFAWGRVFGIFTLYYVVVRLFPDAVSRRRLLLAAAIVGATTGFVSLLVGLGSGLGETLQDPAQQFIRAQEGLGLLERVRLPGLSLAYALFWYALVQAVERRGSSRLGWSAILAGFACSIVLSFNRNMWLGLGAGLLLMLVVSGPRTRYRIAGAVATGLAIVLVAGAGVGFDSTLSPLVERGASLLDPKDLSAEDSLQARGDETAIAMAVAREHPLIGIGPGVEFGVFFNEAHADGSFQRVPQLFVHNQYLYLLLIGGVPALIAFLTFLLGGLKAAWLSGPRTPSTAACGAGLAMIMLSAFVALYFTADDMVLSISLLCGVLFAARLEARERSPDEPVAV